MIYELDVMGLCGGCLYEVMFYDTSMRRKGQFEETSLVYSIVTIANVHKHSP